MDQVGELLPGYGKPAGVELQDRGLCPGPGHAEHKAILGPPGVLLEGYTSMR